jgi:hypothetical protein
MSHDNCVTLAAFGGILAGLTLAWSWSRVRPWVRYRIGPCVCTPRSHDKHESRPGFVRVGRSFDAFEWEPCPFCIRGERARASRPPPEASGTVLDSRTAHVCSEDCRGEDHEAIAGGGSDE